MTLGVFNSPNLVRGCFGKQLVMVTRVFSRLYGSKFVSLKIRRSGSSFSDLQSQLYNFFYFIGRSMTVSRSCITTRRSSPRSPRRGWSSTSCTSHRQVQYQDCPFNRKVFRLTLDRTSTICSVVNFLTVITVLADDV